MIDVRSDDALAELRGRLTRLLDAPAARVKEYDAVVSHIEVNDRHGVGVVLRMLFETHPDILCVRSKSFFGGDNRLGDRHVCIDHDGTDRPRVFATVAQAMTGMRPRRVLCVPYFPADVWNGLVLKYLYGVPLCVYVMDDQSVTTDGIPSALMAEALRAADLRLAISQEMAHAYELKYGQKFWLVPPVVAPALIPSEAPKPDPDLLRTATGVLVGNVWSARWLQMLRAAVRGAGVTLHWYGDDKPTGMHLDRAALAAEGIVHQGFLPQSEFVERLRRYPYAVLATSPLDGEVPAAKPEGGAADETPGARAIARLSLPSRLPFILAAAHCPIVVLGSTETTAARFVDRFDLGRTVAYSAAELRAAVTAAVAPARQAAVRARAAELAPSFSAAPVADWIWRSLALARPADDRYERLMPRRPDELGVP
jgi:hypothetical protein